MSPVHNHGPEDGPGLACREYRVGGPYGTLRGRCLDAAGETPIYDQLVTDRAVSDPEAVEAVEAIHDRVRARREALKRDRLEARGPAGDPGVKSTQALIRAARGGLLGLLR